MKKNIQKTKEVIGIKEKAFMKGMEKKAKTLGISSRPIITFPNPKSFYAKIAIYFLKKSKGILDTQFSNLPPKK